MDNIGKLLGAAAVSGLMFVSCGEALDVTGDDYRVVPLPREINAVAGQDFVLDGGVKIVYEPGNEAMKTNAVLLAEYIRQATGMQLKLAEGKDADGAIVLATGLASDNAEAYTLSVDSRGIVITGATDAGVFYGIQTLRKSLPETKCDKVVMDAVQIADAPRFSYRGAHFDVSRHFFPADSVKAFIDMMALHNLNVLHWHLTDDQGWRLEIKKYPRLTEVGSKRSETVIGRNSGEYDGVPYEGFYTQEEVKDVIAYAADRHVTVIPEIDLPGHMQAAIAAYPELGCTGGPYEVWRQWGVSQDVLCAGNDRTYDFIADVLNEVADLFPSEYIHVGGDECPKDRWKACPKCQARIKHLGLYGDKEHSPEERLQSYVISYAGKVLQERDRKMIGWDEILEGGLAPDATVMSWRGEAGGIKAAQMGHDVIMTPNTYLYFDYYQTPDVDNEPLAIGGCLPVKTVYSYEPVPQQLDADKQKHIIGVQANLWTEYIPTFSHVQYMELPRMAALAEVQWTAPELKDYDGFLKRMTHMFAIYDRLGYNYGKHLLDVNVAFVPDMENGRLGVVLSSMDGAEVRYTLDGKTPDASSPVYTDTLWLDSSASLRAAVFRQSGMSSVYAEEIEFNKATMKPVTMLKPINPGYTYDGAITLVDGLQGNTNYKSRRWIGFVSNDMEAVVDLGAEQEVSKVAVNFCYNTADWIYDARSMKVAVSADGKKYNEVAAEEYPAMTAADMGSGIRTHALEFVPVKARYVKVTAAPEYDMVENPGNNAFIFVDEIKVY